MISMLLLSVGAIAGALAIFLGMSAAFFNPEAAASAVVAAAATPVALGGIALAVVGGILRYCSCCWDDCDWDDEDDKTTTAP